MQNLSQVINYIKESLLKKEAVIVIGSPMLRRTLTDEIDSVDVSIQHSKNKGQLKFFDAAFILPDLLIDGEIDVMFIHRNFAPPIEGLKLKFGAVHVIDEMVDLLSRNEEKFKAIKLKKLWKKKSLHQGFSIQFCKSTEIHLHD